MCAALTLSEYHWQSYATPDVCTLIAVVRTLLTISVRYFALSFIRHSIVMVVHYPWCSFTLQNSKSASRTLCLVFCVVLCVFFFSLRIKDDGFSGGDLGNCPDSLQFSGCFTDYRLKKKRVKFFHKSCVKMAVLQTIPKNGWSTKHDYVRCKNDNFTKHVWIIQSIGKHVCLRTT